MSTDRRGAPSVSYGPGSNAAIAVDGLWLLIDANADLAFVADLWSAAQAGDSEAVLAGVIAHQATGELESGFVLARDDGGGLAVVVGGRGRAGVTVNGHTDELTCPPSADSTEYRFPSPPTDLRIGGRPDSVTSHLPLGAGVVSAELLRLAWLGSGTGEPGTPASGVDPAAGTMLLTGTGASDASDDDGSGAGAKSQEPVVTTESPPLLPPVEPKHNSNDTMILRSESGDTLNAALVGVPDDSAVGSSSTDPGGESSPRDASHGDGVAPEDDSKYDFLFGRTVNRSVEEAAVHPDRDPAEDGQSAVSDGRSIAPTEDEDLVEQPEQPNLEVPNPPVLHQPIVRAPSVGMIDAVPWGPPAQGTASLITAEAQASIPTVQSYPKQEPSRPDSAADGDSFDLTISRAAQRQLAKHIMDAGDDSPAGPSVHAVRCPDGHLNPAHADACRVCGSAVADQPPVTLPRPVLGLLRFSTGDVITLDRGVLIGRRPVSNRSVGDDRPHLVKIPSPDHDISRNHVEIHLDDWHVLVTDLNSTNGTVVTRPGRNPERLRPNQATMIEPGTVVTLADTVTITFEATE